MPRIDQLISAAVDAVRRSGALEEMTLTGVVSAVGSDGTVTVARDTDTYPKVRLLSALGRPTVGDLVVIHRGLGGWTCLGVAQTSNAPRIQRGTVLASNAAATSFSVAVTFPQPFSAVPSVTTDINSGSGSLRYWQSRANSVTAAGFSLFLLTTDAAAGAIDWSSVPVSWIATDL